MEKITPSQKDEGTVEIMSEKNINTLFVGGTSNPFTKKPYNYFLARCIWIFFYNVRICKLLQCQFYLIASCCEYQASCFVYPKKKNIIKTFSGENLCG